MKAKKKSADKLVRVSESALISLVADRLRYKVLFPEKVESSRKFLRSVTQSVI